MYWQVKTKSRILIMECLFSSEYASHKIDMCPAWDFYKVINLFDKVIEKTLQIYGSLPLQETASSHTGIHVSR